MLAFDQAVVSNPPFEAVIHTASPYHFHAKEAQELLVPAITGTTGILKSVQKYAPLVKRVVVTSSFAAINDVYAFAAGKVYSEVFSFHTMQVVNSFKTDRLVVSRRTGVPLQKHRQMTVPPMHTEQAKLSL